MDKFVKELMLAVVEEGYEDDPLSGYILTDLLKKHYGIRFHVGNYHYRPIPKPRFYVQSNPLIPNIYSNVIQEQLENTEKMLKLFRENYNG